MRLHRPPESYCARDKRWQDSTLPDAAQPVEFVADLVLHAGARHHDQLAESSQTHRHFALLARQHTRQPKVAREALLAYVAFSVAHLGRISRTCSDQVIDTVDSHQLNKLISP